MKITNTNFSLFNKPLSKEERQEVHSNPFGINFKGNVLTSDVFESSKKIDANNSSTNPFAAVTGKSKMVASAFVGGINSFNEAFRSRLNSIVSFGRQIKDSIANSWEKAKNTEITLDFRTLADSISSKFNNQYSVNNLLKQPVDDLSAMFKTCEADYKNEIVKA